MVPCVPTPNGLTTVTGLMHLALPVCKINLPTLLDVAGLVFARGFLSPEDGDVMGRAHLAMHPNTLLSNAWTAKPWHPIRKRRWGFGKVHRDRSCTHDCVNPRSMLHFAWQFLDYKDRLNVVRADSSWRQYAKLRRIASTTQLSDLLALKAPRMKPIPTTLDPHRACLNSASLLRFDFNYGDFARWMGGEFTNRHRDWTTEYDKIERILQSSSLPADYPPVRLDLAYKLQTEGGPLKANYETPMSATRLRNEYDNHPAVGQNDDKVHEKFAKEEWKSYHVHFLRFVFEFIPGLVINPIQWVFDKGKGRICIDCSNGPDVNGSVNTHIPSPKEGRELECPQVHFQHAFKRFLRHIMRLRRTCPNHPILVHADDIEAAFRRVLYHPDAAIAFSYVYNDYLMIPVGQVFGSRSAPSFYCILADVRQALAACLPDRPPSHLHPLASDCRMSVDRSTPLTQVPADSHHPPLSFDELDRMFNASYVDDNAVAHFEKYMAQAIDHSVQSAFDVFGTGDIRRGDCLQEQKWTSEVSEEFLFLGFQINTHDMTVSWPLYKREALHAQLTEVMARGPRRYVTPREMAQIVGKVRSASEVAPWGTFLSFNLQNSLNAAAKHAFTASRKWWNRARIKLSKVAVATIQQLMDTLLDDDDRRLWTRPIALYLDRDHTHSVYSDASYGGIGGWSPDFSFLWRVTRNTLSDLGFDMKPIHLRSLEPEEPGDEGLHINPLEFIGALINLWLVVKCVMKSGPIIGGYILALWSDNTTALHWMRLASRTKNPLLQGLARLGAALLVHASQHLTKVCPLHIAGEKNEVADALSRPPNESNPSQNVLDSVIAQWSQLATCRICLLPSKLLSEIASVISSPPTGDQYGHVTTRLLTLEPKFLPIGVRTWASESTIY